MNELLALAIDAHGGLARWNTFKKLVAEVSLGGAIWEFKHQSSRAPRMGRRVWGSAGCGSNRSDPG